MVLVCASTTLAGACSPSTSSPRAQDAGFEAIATAFAVEQQVKVEELTAGCMRRQGFDYRQRDREDIERELEGQPMAIPRVSDLTLEVALAEGYGFSAEVADSWESPAMALGMDEEVSSDLLLAQYDMALHGRDGLEGCRFEASTAAQTTLKDSGFDQLTTDAHGTMERLTADPRYVDLKQQWASCMAAAGHNFSDFSAPQDAARAASNELALDINAALSAELDGGTARPFEEVAEWDSISLGEALDGVLDAEIDRVLAEERQMAVEDAKCRHKVVEEMQRLEVEFLDPLEAAAATILSDLIGS